MERKKGGGKRRRSEGDRERLHEIRRDKKRRHEKEFRGGRGAKF